MEGLCKSKPTSQIAPKSYEKTAQVQKGSSISSHNHNEVSIRQPCPTPDRKSLAEQSQGQKRVDTCHKHRAKFSWMCKEVDVLGHVPGTAVLPAPSISPHVLQALVGPDENCPLFHIFLYWKNHSLGWFSLMRQSVGRK